MRYTILRRLATLFVPEPKYLKVSGSGQIIHNRNTLYRQMKRKFRRVPVAELRRMLHHNLHWAGEV